MTNKEGEGVISVPDTVISGDYYEVFVRNLTDTSDMVMTNMSLTIR
jgi:hypothetical protein